MANEFHEIEHTYEPAADAELPDLARLPGVHSVEGGEPVELDAVYFDTATLALTRAHVSLRRRAGGSDAGWHLKVPSGRGRDEVHLPLSRSKNQPPKPLRTAVLAWTLGEPVVAIATVRSRRTPRWLRDETGAVLAELVDDAVEAEVHVGKPAGGQVTWREWELELREGDERLLAAADELMSDAGAPPATLDRKIARALGDLLPPPAAAPAPGRHRPARHVLQARLTEQVAELKRRDCEVRRDASDGVHQARVALRRLRSLLQTFRPLADRGVTEPLRAELRWAGQVLGDARDAEVVHETIRGVLDAEPVELVTGPVGRRVDRELRVTHHRSTQVAKEALESERYLAMLATLDRLVAEAPWTAKADGSAAKVLRKLLRKDLKRLRDRAAAVERATSSTARDAALHETRKAAKRMRYAAETLEPAFGRPAHRLTKLVKRVQSTLGDHHDTVVARSVLHDVAERAHREGERGFTYGRLHAALEQQAVALEATYARAWRRADRAKVRSWLG